MKRRIIWRILIGACLLPSVSLNAEDEQSSEVARIVPVRPGVGIVAVLEDADAALKHALESNALVYFQSSDRDKIAALRQKAVEQGLLGTRLFVDEVHGGGLHMAANLADSLIAPSDAGIPKAELLRIVHPGGKVVVGETTLTKKVVKGSDDWAYPNHGSDNNPLSIDPNARYPYYLQFIEYPKMAVFYEMTVIGGGRIYKSYGDWSGHGRYDLVNTLFCMNAYNGQIIWTQNRNPKFMNYRNTMIATPEGLYIADDKSLKLLSREDGATLKEIAILNEDATPAVWKWMALDGDCLLALVGGKEKEAPHLRGGPRLGGWTPAPTNGWSNLGPKNADDSFVFPYMSGKRLVRIDAKTRKIVWEYAAPAPIDGRAVCFS